MKVLSALMVLSILTACGGSGGSGGENSGGSSAPPAKPPAVVQDTTGTIYGKLLDQVTGKPLAKATIRAAGKTVLTGPDGSFVFESLTLGRTVVVAQAAGYAEQVRVAQLNAYQGRQQIEIRALAVSSVHAVDVISPQTLLDTTSVARVVLPANSLVLANGSLPTGAVRGEITRIDPGPDPSVMPGDFSTANGPLQTYGAITVNFWDAAGQPLNLAPGKKATIRIPLAQGASLVFPDTVPLWHLNTETGLWVREGSATRVGTGATGYYEGEVSHFSTWNADDLLNSIQLTGRLTDETGAPLGGVTVGSVGEDYSGYATAVTDANGNFTVPMRTNSKGNVIAFLNGVQSSVLPVVSATSNITLASALVMPSTAGARLVLGEPKVVEVPLDNDCCRVFTVQIPFKATGMQLQIDGNGFVMQSRWEIRHVFAQAVATPERWLCESTQNGNGPVVCLNPATQPESFSGGVPTPYVNPYGFQQGLGIAPKRADSTTSGTGGVLEYTMSVHNGRFNKDITPTSVSFFAVLAVDVRNPITGATITVRSAGSQITIPL